MTFSLGKASLKELNGVHSHLVVVVKRAIQITTQDFAVHDGIRTREEQLRFVDSGASTVVKSRHLTGHAVDLVPYLNGKLRWEWALIYPIAVAMRTAAKELDIPTRWGGAWDVQFTASTATPEKLVAAYVARRKRLRKRVFLDGPHFELPAKRYPL